MKTYLRVKNLAKHQHYKDRSPPWIKLHAEVLDDYEFACLHDASKAHLMLIWVLASRMDNRMPNDPAWIAHRVNATGPVDIDALVSAGFIERCDVDGNPLPDASAPLAPCKQTAMPEERRGEGETEAETALPRAAAPVVLVVDPLPEPALPLDDRPGPEPKAPRTKKEPKYPHYPAATSDALHAVWELKRGQYDRARFRRETAGLFTTTPPRYTLPQLEGALRACFAVLEHRANTQRQHFDWSALTPARWAGRIVEWVAAHQTKCEDGHRFAALLDAGTFSAAAKVSA